MSYLQEKAQYLKGLADGLSLDSDSKEGKLFAAIIEMLSDIAGATEEIVDIQDEMQLQLDEVDEDLADLEDYIFEDEDDEDELFDCDDEGVYLTCPECGEDIYIEFTAIGEDGTITCPACEETFELECDCDCESCSECE